MAKAQSHAYFVKVDMRAITEYLSATIFLIQNLIFTMALRL
jgi:hypothetical protein